MVLACRMANSNAGMVTKCICISKNDKRFDISSLKTVHKVLVYWIECLLVDTSIDKKILYVANKVEVALCRHCEFKRIAM